MLPLILLYLFGYGVSLDATRTPIGVVMERATPSARELLAAFQASPSFDAVVAADRRDFEDPLARGEVRGIVVIPSAFDADLWKRSTSPEIQLIVDGSEPNTALLMQGYAQGVVAGWAASRLVDLGRAGPNSVAEARVWFNPGLTSRFFWFPAASPSSWRSSGRC